MPFETYFQVDLGSRSQGSNKGQNRSYIELVRAITCTFMHGFQNNFAQFLSSRRRSVM